MIIHLKHSAGVFRKIVRSTSVDTVVNEIDELCRKMRRSGFGMGADLVQSFVFVELLAWPNQKEAEQWASELKSVLVKHWVVMLRPFGEKETNVNVILRIEC